jgi:hypothetical protein
MAREPLRLNLAIGLGEGASAEELDEAARLLRRELVEAGVGEVELAAAGPPPDGTKSAETFLLGALTLSLLPAALTTALSVIRDWAGRRPGRTLQFEYDAGPQRLKLEYDPDKTDVNQLLALLLQAPAAEPSAHLSVGGDVVAGDKTTHTQAGGDVVGRDKVTTIQMAPDSTLIVNDPARVALKAPPPPDEVPLPPS